MFSLPYETTIAGVSFNNADGTSRQEYVQHLLKGDILFLRDGSTSEHPEAIAVFNKFDIQLGFLHSDVAKQLRLMSYPFTSMVCMVKFIGQKSASMPYGATIVIGEDRESVLSTFSDIDRRFIEGPNYRPKNTYNYSYSSPSYAEPQRNKKKRGSTILGILLCLIVVIPIICFIVYTFKTFSFLF